MIENQYASTIYRWIIKQINTSKNILRHEMFDERESWFAYHMWSLLNYLIKISDEKKKKKILRRTCTNIVNYINKIYGYEIKDIDDFIPYIMHMSLFTYVYFIFMQCPTDKRFIDICVLLTWPEPSCIANNYTNYITWWHNSSGMKSTCVLMLVSLFQMFKTHTSGMSTVFGLNF